MIQLSEQHIRETRHGLDNERNSQTRREMLMDVLQLTPFIKQRKIISVGDLPIHCELYESGKKDPVIIFLPGIGTYAEMYCEFLSKLSSWGFNVVGVDLRGHGYSGGERGVYTVGEVIEDIRHVVDEMIKRFNPNVSLFGCSIGAPLARACAENDPRIKALLCHTLFLSEYPPDFMTLTGWNMLRMSNLFLPDFKIDFRSFIDVESLLSGNPYADFVDYDTLIVWEYTVRTLSDIYSYKTRLLSEAMNFKAAIITGDHDEVLTIDYMTYIVSKMKHPFEIITIPNARHMLPFLNIRETVLAARDWFRENLG